MKEFPAVRKKLISHNHPEWIAVTEYIADLFDDMRRFLDPDDTILQLGCGCGYILDALWEMGFRHLSGLDMIKVPEKENLNPAYKIIHADLTEHIDKLKLYDVILCHRFLYIQPKENEWLFEKIAKKVKKFFVVVEIEERSRIIPRHCWKRNYQKIFEQFGLKQVFTEANVFPLQSAEIMTTITRVFKKI